MQRYLLVFIGLQLSCFKFKDHNSDLLLALGIRVICQSVSVQHCDGEKRLKGQERTCSAQGFVHGAYRKKEKKTQKINE